MDDKMTEPMESTDIAELVEQADLPPSADIDRIDELISHVDFTRPTRAYVNLQPTVFGTPVQIDIPPFGDFCWPPEVWTITIPALPYGVRGSLFRECTRAIADYSVLFDAYQVEHCVAEHIWDEHLARIFNGSMTMPAAAPAAS